MNTFEWIDAASVEQAAQLLAATTVDQPIVAKAGGMDLLDLMKEGILQPSRIVNLRTITGLDGIRETGDGTVTLGALTTLSQIESSLAIRERYPALATAAAHAATPQVRHAATIGGNLLQRPRDWYFRNQPFHTGEVDINEAVAHGEHQYHAIFDNSRTALVHASTPATALVAYDADVELVSATGRRTVALKDFFLAPDVTRDRDVTLERGEVLVHVALPPTSANTRAAYHKQTERESYDWPICDVAVVLQMDGTRVANAVIAMGWVAPVPRRAGSAEHVLVGQPVTEAAAAAAAKAAVADATPLPKNQYKVQVLETVVRRTILAAAGT